MDKNAPTMTARLSTSFV